MPQQGSTCMGCRLDVVSSFSSATRRPARTAWLSSVRATPRPTSQASPCAWRLCHCAGCVPLSASPGCGLLVQARRMLGVDASSEVCPAAGQYPDGAMVPACTSAPRTQRHRRRSRRAEGGMPQLGRWPAPAWPWSDSAASHLDAAGGLAESMPGAAGPHPGGQCCMHPCRGRREEHVHAADHAGAQQHHGDACALPWCAQRRLCPSGARLAGRTCQGSVRRSCGLQVAGAATAMGGASSASAAAQGAACVHAGASAKPEQQCPAQSSPAQCSQLRWQRRQATDRAAVNRMAEPPSSWERLALMYLRPAGRTLKAGPGHCRGLDSPDPAAAEWFAYRGHLSGSAPPAQALTQSAHVSSIVPASRRPRLQQPCIRRLPTAMQPWARGGRQLLMRAASSGAEQHT